MNLVLNYGADVTLRDDVAGATPLGFALGLQQLYATKEAVAAARKEGRPVQLPPPTAIQDWERCVGAPTTLVAAACRCRCCCPYCCCCCCCCADPTSLADLSECCVVSCVVARP